MADANVDAADTPVEEMSVRRRIIHFAIDELQQSNNGKPTQEQMDNYLRASGLYTLNRDGSWPGPAVQWFWDYWCGLFALYCLQEAGVPDLRWDKNPDNGGKFGIHGGRARLALSDGRGGFKIIRDRSAVLPRAGDIGVGGGREGHAGSHHFILWMPYSDGNRLCGFNCIDGNGLAQGRLPVTINPKTLKPQAPPCQMLRKTYKPLNGYILKTNRKIEEIGAIYSLDLDGLV
jgi:hypothetical protein